MGNMGYCRFENTLNDLKDCVRHLDDEDLSDSENKARQELIAVAINITSEYGDE